MNYVYSGLLLLAGLLGVNLVISYQSKHIDPNFWMTLKYQLYVLPLYLIINMCIGYGIKLGYKAAGSLSFALIASKGLEIFISLLMGFIFMKEVPGWRTWTGVALILIGFVVAKGK
ncbi:hypothetical protein [Paenibacillus pinihumi]|uniref:hypothetical protein n=1 Tax=Paenibacillus pinihumi TaxID=669462 RepID=UPI0004204B32|nr:hypothetical protein [Paenibacillus pinihumi]